MLTEYKISLFASHFTTRCYAGTPRPELLPVTVWHYDSVNLELGHDVDLQIILIQVEPMIT